MARRLRGWFFEARPLITTHGDNIAAYDAWKKAINCHADELTALYIEVFAWKKGQKDQPPFVEMSLKEGS